MADSGEKITRVLLVDSQLTVRAGVRLLINQRLDVEVTAEANTMTEALSMLNQRPDVIIINLHLSGQVDYLPELTALAQQARVILLVSNQDLETYYRALGEAIQAGIKGVVFRDDPEEALGNAIERVAAGGVALDPSTLARVLGNIVLVNNTQKTDLAASRLTRLTPREREIVTSVGAGLKNKQIAARLSLSEATIRHHLTAIFNKLDVADRVGLAVYAHRCGLV